MLNASEKWLDAAHAGTAEPVVLVEIRPTVLHAEVGTDAGWDGSQNLSNMDLVHPTGELRLAPAEVVHPEKQETSRELAGYTFLHNAGFEENSSSYARDRYDRIGQFIQTFHVGRGCRVREIWIGARANKTVGKDAFNHNLVLRVFAGLKGRFDRRMVTPSYWHSPAWQWAVDDLYSRAELLLTLRANFGEHNIRGAEMRTLGSNTFMVFDLSEHEEAFYLPSNSVCALDLMVDHPTGAEHVRLFGATGGEAYGQGQLYEHNHMTGDSYDRAADIGFRFLAEGYQLSGSGIWELDLGETPGASLSGELELRYCAPSGTTLTFQVREKEAPLSGYGSWRAASDGSALTGKRFVQVRVNMTAAADGLDSPRIYSIRAAYKRSDRFVMGALPLEGCPNLVLSGPDYTSEGDPLDGRASLTDNSRIELADPEGMLRSMFDAWDVKNDEVIASLGFAGLDPADFLPLKKLWIEDWEPFSGRVTLHLHDRQGRLIETEIPETVDPPQDTEQIRFSLTTLGAIKREMLQRSRVRPSQILESGLAALDFAFDWLLSRELAEPAPASKTLQAINRHLLGFDCTDELGRWQSPFVDFEAAPLATILPGEIVLGSEQFSPGWRGAKTAAAVFFGAEGESEKDYPAVAIVSDDDAAERFKEITVDKLYSEWIPEWDDAGDVNSGIAVRVARRRLTLVRAGLRAISWSTLGLSRAPLQIGDHVHLHAGLYSRPGATSPNPLLVMITRKSFDRGLGQIHWGGLVLLDSNESLPGLTPVAVPSGFAVTDNGNGSVTWTWNAASGDGTVITRYQLYRRRWSLDTWGAPVREIPASGAGSYEILDEGYVNTIAYDFGLRAVDRSGRVSAMLEVQDVQTTNNLPSAPEWELRAEEAGWSVWITADSAGASEYLVYFRNPDTGGWDPKGAIRAPRLEGKFKSASTPGHFFLGADSLRPVYGRIRLSARNGWGEGAPGAEQAAWSRPYMGTMLASELVPSLPEESGTWPRLTRTQVSGGDWKFRVEIKVLAPAGYEDLVLRYEMQRRDNEGGDWNDWTDLPSYPVTADPAPAAVLWTNSDAALKPGVTYQWRARAVGRDGNPSDWCEPLEKGITDDATPPDKPVITSATAHPLGIELVFAAPAEGGGPIHDFSHFRIEGYEVTAGTWVTVNGDCRTLRTVYPLTEGAIAQSWKFRVTAYDRQGNASAVSDETAYVSATRVGTGALTSAVNSTLSQVLTNTSTISSHSTSISQNAQEIALRAYSATVSAIDGRLTSAEGSISVMAGQIALKVAADGVIAAINLSPEEIAISASRIALQGQTITLGNPAGYYLAFNASTGELLTNATFKSFLGSGANDEQGVQIGRLGGGGIGEVQVVSGNLTNVVGILGGAGVYPSTERGAARLYLKNQYSGSSSSTTTEITLNAKLSEWKYDGNVVLQIDNNAAGGGGLVDFANIQIDAGRGINVTGMDSLMRYIAVNGNQVVGPRGAAIDDASETVVSVKTQLNLLLAFLRTWGAIASS